MKCYQCEQQGTLNKEELCTSCTGLNAKWDRKDNTPYYDYTLKQKLAKKLADEAMVSIMEVKKSTLYENEVQYIARYFEEYLLELNGYPKDEYQ